eukprot:GHVU01207997.1.p1 GENE.GHVU01207997.1~~GHVU01207997.1.p1  ORF type:complete len:111 (+),score=15.72 GHVU01207997.1:275-607(+)
MNSSLGIVLKYNIIPATVYQVDRIGDVKVVVSLTALMTPLLDPDRAVSPSFRRLVAGAFVGGKRGDNAAARSRSRRGQVQVVEGVRRRNTASSTQTKSGGVCDAAINRVY